MTIVKLKGGLGNQMFQYAYGQYLKSKGRDVIFDISFYSGNRAKGDMPRVFGLNNFNLNKDSKFSDKRHKVIDLISKIFTRLGLRDSGYWQAYKYAEEIRDNLIKEFSLKKPLELDHPEILNKIESTESVSLAIRRSDYLLPQNLRSLGICSSNYYKKALEVIISKTNKPNFFIFSDDIDWVKSNISFNNHPVFYVSENKQEKNLADYQEMMLMSKCQHNIIANSSFSWWPAWLNQNPDKIVIAPDIWFTDKSVKVEDIIPPTWIKLPRN